MADVGIESSPSDLEVAANGKVGEDLGAGALEKQSGVEDEGKIILANEKIERGFVEKEQEGGGKDARGGEEGKKEESKVKTVEKEDEREEIYEEVVGKKKRGRKPKAVEAGATPEAGEKKSSGAEKHEGKRKKRKLSVTEPLTPSDRPSRERKSIDRFVVSTEKERAKGVQILEGSGTPLKDIPNVAYNVGKKSKTDSLLRSLHSLLYGGRRMKASVVKNNILQFSGFVWGEENQEKDMAKAKERLERLTKENLTDISNLLDIKVSKTTIKKEELIAKLLEFLESPYQATDVLLEDKEHERKRKSSSPGKRTRGRPPKNQKSEDTPAKRGRKKHQSFEEGSAEEDAHEEMEDTMVDKDPDDAEEFEEKVVEEKVKPGKKLGRGKVVSVAASEQKNSTEKKEKKGNQKSPSKLPSVSKVHDKPTSKVPSKMEKKGKEEQKETKGKSGKGSKATGKVQPKLNVKEKPSQIAGKRRTAEKIVNKAGKIDAKGKDVEKSGQYVKAFPSDSQLRAEICELLREADFSAVTFTDVVKQLEAKFKVSLLERKAHVKVLIREEISKIAEEGEEEDGDDEQVEDLTEKSQAVRA